jgi:hypothetical protein
MVSEVDAKDKRILRIREGQIADDVARELGLVFYSSKDGDEVYWFYYHPLNTVALDSMRGAFTRRGMKLQIQTVDPQTSRDVASVMLGREVLSRSQEFVQTFELEGGIQMPPFVDRTINKLIARYHPRLASAAIMVVIDDFDPAEMAQKLYKGQGQKEVWAFAKKTSGAFFSTTGYDFIITICTSIWKMLDKETKRYLLDHELSHCGRSEKGRWELWDHDIQLFSEEIKRYGSRIQSLRKSIENINAMVKEAKTARKDSEED